MSTPKKPRVPPAAGTTAAAATGSPRRGASTGSAAGEIVGTPRKRGSKPAAGERRAPKRAKKPPPRLGGGSGEEASKSTFTRERILDAAAEVLNSKGYAGTRLSDIADVVQLQAPAIYYYFASREELIEQVVEVGQREVIDHVKAALVDGSGATALDRILVAVRAHLEVVLERSQYTSASVRNMGQLPDDMRARQLKLRAEYGKVWRDLFAAGRDSGELDPELDLYSARMFVLGALNWAPEWWDPRRGSLESISTTAELIVRTGLARR